ncbi:MAG TPA: VWA domain-containing protein [Blastocatellia bacterium]|nr:VWA domain-containing protein [Blastocatellia bacterium]
MPVNPESGRPHDDNPVSSDPNLASTPAEIPSSQDSLERPAVLASAQQQTGQPKTDRRREAPPFDRPPLRGRSDAGAGAENPTPERSTPADPGRTQPAPPPDAEAPPRRAPPELRRAPRDPRDNDRGAAPSDPADSSSEPSRSNRRLPELRRPGGPPTNGDSVPQPPDARRSRSGPRPSTPQEGGDDTIRLDATLVNIPVLVSDRSGRYVPQLSKRDFALYEDGVQQEIAFFGSEEVPFNVALLLDVSPSVAASLEEIQDAAIEFVRQLRPQDRVMVASFDRHIDYLTDFTSNRRELEWAIRRTATGNGTSVYDAVYETVVRRLKNVEGRKALILFSDGEDTTSSVAGYDDAVEAVTESDVLVYGLRYPSTGRASNNPGTRSPIPQIQLPIPFPWPWPRKRKGPFADSHFAPDPASAPAAGQWGRRNRDGDFMTDITTAGGGPVYDAEQISDLSRLASRIAEELRHVYVMSYYPTNPLSNGGYRHIRVRVVKQPDIAVRHRRGYEARDPNQKGRI